MSYQAASGIFPMLVAILALKRWNQQENWKDILQFVVVSAAGYLIGMLVFALTIMQPRDDYVSNSIPALGKILPYTWANLKAYYRLVVTDLKKEWLVLIGVLCVGFVYTTVRESKQKRGYALLMGIIVLGALLVMAFGLYPVLENPLFAPRAMYGFGAFVCFVCVYVVFPRGPKAYAVDRIACVALCWCFFVFGFTYGNALQMQKTYTDFRISAVVDDLDESGVLDTEETKTVQIAGSIGRAPALEAMRQDYQILNRLVPITFGDSSWEFGGYGFYHYYGLNNLKRDTSVDLREMDLPVVVDSIYHTVRAEDSYILIELKR